MDNLERITTIDIDADPRWLTRTIPAEANTITIPAEANTIVDVSSKYLTLDGLKQYTDRLMEQLAKAPVFEHKCNNCGGTIELMADQHIFKCPYCGSVYAIGTLNING